MGRDGGYTPVGVIKGQPQEPAVDDDPEKELDGMDDRPEKRGFFKWVKDKLEDVFMGPEDDVTMGPGDNKW